MDTRTDPGQYYPGGRVMVRPDVAPGQMASVKWSDIEGKPDFSDIAALGEEATHGETKQTVNTIINKLNTSVLVGALLFAGTAAADVAPLFAKADDIPGNQQIMTNTQAYVDAKVAGVPTPGDYANVSNKAINAATHTELTNATSMLRGKGDLAVYKKVGTGNSWTLVDSQGNSYHGIIGTYNGYIFDFYRNGTYVAASQGDGQDKEDDAQVEYMGDMSVGGGGIAYRDKTAVAATSDSLAKMSEVISSTGGVIRTNGSIQFQDPDAEPQYAAYSGFRLNGRKMTLLATSFEIESDENSLDISNTDIFIPSGYSLYLREEDTTLHDFVVGEASGAAGATLSAVSNVETRVGTLGSQVSAIGSYLNAEDARFVSTNYDSVTRLPEAYVEVRLNDHGTNKWVEIWREMRRWNVFTGLDFDWNSWGGFHTFKTNVTAELAFKADRAWGAYDSETGGYSPEGYTQVSSSNILIGAGMAYQRTITSDGAVWVLQCNQGVATIGGDTNGYFRIMDADGNTQFEIIKGDKREVGADATGITVGSGNVMTIPYSVEAGEHPVIQCTANLSAPNWKAETDGDCLCTVSWSGSSGAWVATVTPKTSQASMFVKATYMAGGETYIRNAAPVGMDRLYLNGTLYYLGTATINGHTVLTLSTTAP